jgi:hypothetical protein
MSTRKFSRVRFNVEATIKTGVRQFKGGVENLSMSGMFLVTDERLPLDKSVNIKIVLTGVVPPVSVAFSGRVSRIAGNGIGFVFEKIDLDSYMHLKNIVAYNSVDAEKVMEEIRHSIDEKHTVE